MYIVVVLDWYNKKIVGYYAGVQCCSKHWLEALYDAVKKQFPEGVRGHQLHLMSDNGCQPTSLNFMMTCKCLGIQQAFTSYNNFAFLQFKPPNLWSILKAPIRQGSL